MTPAIRVQNLSKHYSIGVRRGDGYRTLRESLMATAAAAWNRARNFSKPGPGPERPDRGVHKALDGVDFEIRPGEVVGIIGRNGAGKSTLLKILSRITEPTSGRVELRGRVGSLLEVGTGFHPELTGRENIYLNGSILGLSRRDIAREFDAIVAFSEIEKFLDTPVKRYSSGMYVRLAFAVAAHLEPEVLIVDEVLAVGDASFQKKCIRKMGEVGRAGRTVLIVSHNLASITKLCSRALVLEQGKMVDQGEASGVVSNYLTRMREDPGKELEHRNDREGSGAARAAYIRFKDDRGNPVCHVLCGDPLTIVVGYRARSGLRNPHVALSLWSSDGHKIFHVDNDLRGQHLRPYEAEGEYRCCLRRLNVTPGSYYLNLMLKDGDEMLDHVYSSAELEVLPGDFYGVGKASSGNGGLILVDHDWN